MGPKITVDSATMFNKGLEVIEAAYFFEIEESRIGVLVHPQSIVHGMVCYQDGSVVAQLGVTDMRIPIAHALAWPGRMATPVKRLDLAEVARLEFHEPDLVRFPALRLARSALTAGGGAPAILNAANETAVSSFLADEIRFTDIASVVEAVLNRLGTLSSDTVNDIMAIDAAARCEAANVVANGLF
jgi:1-deoxy-D-xylulose-5-phosphate reductoisomerase